MTAGLSHFHCPYLADEELGFEKPSASFKVAEIQKDGACPLSLAVLLWHSVSLQRRMERGRVPERGGEDFAQFTVIRKAVRAGEMAQWVRAFALQT